MDLIVEAGIPPELLSLKDDKGLTPLQAAKASKFQYAVKILEQMQQKQRQ